MTGTTRRRRMERTLPISILCASLALASSPATLLADDDRPDELPYRTAGTIPLLSSTPAEPRIVTLTDHGLLPEQVTISPTERLAWRSYAGEATTIVFEREVAASMACHNLVNFYIEDDELRSGEIHTLDLVHFCDLDPGVYHYTVVREKPDSRAKRRMKGTIVVRAM